MLSFKDMARLNAMEREIADLKIRLEALEAVAAKPAEEPVKSSDEPEYIAEGPPMANRVTGDEVIPYVRGVWVDEQGRVNETLESGEVKVWPPVEAKYTKDGELINPPKRKRGRPRKNAA